MMVTRLDASMVSELYVMREVLESTAAALAARHATDVEISLLRDIVERDLAFAEDPDKLAVNNRLFHETLHRCAHNRYLLKTLRSLHESMALLGRSTLAVPGAPEAHTKNIWRWWKRWKPAIRRRPSRSPGAISSRRTRCGCRCGSRNSPRVGSRYRFEVSIAFLKASKSPAAPPSAGLCFGMLARIVQRNTKVCSPVRAMPGRPRLLSCIPRPRLFSPFRPHVTSVAVFLWGAV